MTARVLIIAGSDSGGGAGIQADIKTVTALGGYAMTAITAITVQNTLGVTAVHDVPTDIISGQIDAVLSDIGADVIKFGMLSSTAVIEAVAKTLESRKIPRVVDPVMRAKGGHALLADEAAGALKRLLIPGAALVTPNLPEAEALTGRKITTVNEMSEAIPALLQLGAEAVLLKGGHLTGERLVDMLITPREVMRFEDERIHTTATHGTGCTLASAISTGMAQGLSVRDAVTRARAYVREAMRTAVKLGQGHGPLNHGHTVTRFPR